MHRQRAVPQSYRLQRVQINYRLLHTRAEIGFAGHYVIWCCEDLCVRGNSLQQLNFVNKYLFYNEGKIEQGQSG